MKRYARIAFSATIAILISSCASYQIPDNYSGSTATIRSTGKPVSSVKGEGYYIMTIDGKTANHSPMATPSGGGLGLSLGDQISSGAM